MTAPRPGPAWGSAIATGRFTCPVCPQRFSSMGDKKRHMRDEHPKGSPEKG